VQHAVEAGDQAAEEEEQRKERELEHDAGSQNKMQSDVEPSHSKVVLQILRVELQ
jgi:hypothetical protein